MKTRSFALGLGLLALTASATLAQSSFRAPVVPKTDGEVTLEFWSWTPASAPAAALYTKLHPNVKIKVSNFGGGPTYEKLRTSIKAGSGAPDVVQIEFEQIPGFVETGGLLDLNKFGASKLRTYFVPWTWRQASPDGKAIYALPQDSGPFGMVYRKDILDKYDIKVPTTWDEYAKAGEELFKKTGGKVKIGNFYNTSAWFIALTWAAGGQLWKLDGDGYRQTLNSPAAKKVARYWGELVKKGYVSTYKAFSPDYFNALSRGEIATAFEAAWGPGLYAGSLEKNPGVGAQYRVANLPQWSKNGRVASGNWGGSTTAVTTQSKNQAAAYAFAVWLNTSRDALVAGWRSASLFPAAQSGLGLVELKDQTKASQFFGNQEIMDVFKVASKGVNANFVWAPWLPATGASYEKQIDAAIQGEQSFEQAMDRWQAEVLEAARKDGYTVR